MRKNYLILTIILFFYSFNGIGQIDTIKLRSLKDTSKIKYISTFDAFTVRYYDTLNNSDYIFNNFRIRYSDPFQKFYLQNDSIESVSSKLELLGDRIEDSVFIYYSDKAFTKKFAGDGYVIYQKYPIDSLLTIEIKNTIRPYLKPLAKTSLFTALIISPLVSYNFKQKQMNSSRYNKWMLGSLGSLTLFLSLKIPFKDKVYKVVDYYNDKAEWKIIN